MRLLVRGSLFLSCFRSVVPLCVLLPKPALNFNAFMLILFASELLERLFLPVRIFSLSDKENERSCSRKYSVASSPSNPRKKRQQKLHSFVWSFESASRNWISHTAAEVISVAATLISFFLKTPQNPFFCTATLAPEEFPPLNHGLPSFSQPFFLRKFSREKLGISSFL